MGGRAFVTGISSFTGPYLAEALGAAGYEVFGLGSSKESVAGVTMYQGNLLDESSLQKAIVDCSPTVVVHLAAITFVPHGDIGEMYLTNIVGTRNLLSVLADLREAPDKVILASSANVYGNATEGMLDESAPFAPANDYAASKVSMEYMASIWSDRLPIVIARPFNYTGVGQEAKFLVPKIVNHFRDKKSEIELGNTHVIRDFSDVRYVAEAYRVLIEHGVVGEAYNICSGDGRSLEDIISFMNELAGYEIKVSVNPAFVRSNEVKRLVGTNEKLSLLDRLLLQRPLEETLEWMYSHRD